MYCIKKDYKDNVMYFIKMFMLHFLLVDLKIGLVTKPKKRKES